MKTATCCVSLSVACSPMERQQVPTTAPLTVRGTSSTAGGGLAWPGPLKQNKSAPVRPGQQHGSSSAQSAPHSGSRQAGRPPQGLAALAALAACWQPEGTHRPPERAGSSTTLRHSVRSSRRCLDNFAFCGQAKMQVCAF